MTVYYSLTFMLLAAEMVTFCLLVAPLPYKIRKSLFRFLSESYAVAKVAYALKISFIFVAILFVDALQRMFRVTAESDLAKSGQGGATDVRTETNLAARKFYSQRNTYLTGFTLFLSLVLTRTFYILLDLVQTQEQYAELKKQASGKTSVQNGDDKKQVAELKNQIAVLEAKERDFETLKKQASQQAAEFDRLASKYNEATGSVSNKRSD
ncbi:endoplasmic reticulum protein [Collybia nuda]|uniref:Endoplasmic reticulum transmembrane protein n=1 Tax=Collybia nuda TaxID=64659 RepID=A0A9P5YGK3_9AGAR|nr:endoplasmic reticulum protein [Collybia nuda]